LTSVCCSGKTIRLLLLLLTVSRPLLLLLLLLVGPRPVCAGRGKLSQVPNTSAMQPLYGTVI
jgi:hypothetical protein